MDSDDDFRSNRLLAQLDDAALLKLAPQLSPIRMDVGDPVMAHGRPIRRVWFPAEGVISMLAPEEGRGHRVEVGTIGKEGMAGASLLLGTPNSPGDLFVQIKGHGWGMPAEAFMDAAHSVPGVADVVLRYAHTLFIQASQGCACNIAHSALQRCARWLLMTHDRVKGDDFVLTQEYLGHMLGERRATVSQVASTLKSRRLISYNRGHITVLNREGLEDVSCPCYGIIRREYEGAIGGRQE
jgi:CRP-like cAMP-binding protein